MKHGDVVEIVRYSLFLLCTHGPYFTPSNSGPEVILKKLAVKQLGVEQ